MIFVKVKTCCCLLVVFLSLLIHQSESSTQVPEVTIDSVGMFSNPKYFWSVHVTNLTIRYRFSFDKSENQTLPSTESVFRVSFDKHTNAADLNKLSISSQSCVIAPDGSQAGSSFLVVKCNSHNSSQFEMNLTITRPSINLDGKKILLKFPPYTNNSTTIESKSLNIKQCPVNFENFDLIIVKSSTKSSTIYGYKDTVKVLCSSGLLLANSSGRMEVGSENGQMRTCGPFTEWEEPTLECWEGPVMNINKQKSHHVYEAISKPTLYRCNNKDPTNIKEVTLQIGHDISVTSSKVALKTATLPVTHQKHPIRAICTQHYKNHSDTSLHIRLHVFKHAIRFLNHKSLFRVYVGYEAVIEIPITSPTPISVHQINITKRGVHVNNFNVRQFKWLGKKQLIIMKIIKISMHDLGNYTITVTSSSSEIARTHIEVEGIIQRVSTSMLAGVIIGSLLLVAIIVGVIVVFIIKAKRYRKLNNENTGSEEDIVMNIEETNVDNVFASNPDIPHSSEMRLMSSSVNHAPKGNDPKSPNGFLYFPEPNDADKVSINTETSNAGQFDQQNDDVFVTDAETASVA